MHMEEVKSLISSVKFKKMGNDSIQYNVRTLRGFIQLAPYKLYETNLNVCLLLLARGARTCRRVRVEFYFFQIWPVLGFNSIQTTPGHGRVGCRSL